MSLMNQVNEEMKAAMRNKDQGILRGLRAIKAALLLAKTEKGASEELTSEQEQRVLQKLVKQRRESIEIYEKQGRMDLLQQEMEELEVINKFLPEQMPEDELRAKLKSIIQQVGATSPKETGKVMPVAMKELSGKADGKQISRIVNELLQGQL